jgi:(1->4)-alpha-D-glucan 1-alpha-D-glucosylmutase
MTARRHLGSTYRLQLNGVGFAAAAGMVPFLHRLGVETCYVSPVTRATAGSRHGYDVIDPSALDPALGSPAEFEELLSALAVHQMGLLIDIVPNHMAASVENPYFADVLRHGRGSEFASYFDIAWDEQEGRILLPVLGKPLAEALDAGEISLVADDPSLLPMIAYFDHRFPVAPGSVDGPATEPVALLLSRQHYRLADWRVANREVNYRRFFDINELIGVRQEDPAVFAATHRLAAELAADPRIVGVRVDHVDGLYDPAGYLAMLREVCGRSGSAPVIVVEKILAESEALADWPVDGTTGYEFAALVVGLFVAARGATDLAYAAARATGDDRSFAERAVEAKRRAIDALFPHQLEQVTAHFVGAINADAGFDLAVADVAEAIRELTACLAVYRTYRRADTAARAEDLQRLQVAAERARHRLSGDVLTALDRVVDLLAGGLDALDAAWQATGSWQQLSGPVAAKGVEDTALYSTGCLLVAADVGSDPDRVAVSASEFHAAMTDRAQHGRLALSSTSTHDSKRSHDVRCRLAVLSEVADEWETTVEALDTDVLSTGGALEPDAADRRYVYETIVGAWPVDGTADNAFAVRISDHLVKAAREAKRHSSWLDPDPAYEAGLQRLADRIILGDSSARRLLESAVSSIECAGVVNSLASVVLKSTAPGVPDTYQGDDSWFFALVDPDNRSPVDAARHRQLLSQLPEWSDDADHRDAVGALLDDWRSGAVKQLVVRNSLVARRGAREVFRDGRYQPIDVIGEMRDHVIAFARVHGEDWMITVVPRLVHALADPGQFPVGAACWTETEVVLPAGSPRAFTDVLTGRSIPAPSAQVPISSAFAVLPVALLSSG